jgi:hypothetical protein
MSCEKIPAGGGGGRGLGPVVVLQLASEQKRLSLISPDATRVSYDFFHMFKYYSSRH